MAWLPSGHFQSETGALSFTLVYGSTDVLYQRSFIVGEFMVGLFLVKRASRINHLESRVVGEGYLSIKECPTPSGVLGAVFDKVVNAVGRKLFCRKRLGVALVKSTFYVFYNGIVSPKNKYYVPQ